MKYATIYPMHQCTIPITFSPIVPDCNLVIRCRETHNSLMQNSHRIEQDDIRLGAVHYWWAGTCEIVQVHYISVHINVMARAGPTPTPSPPIVAGRGVIGYNKPVKNLSSINRPTCIVYCGAGQMWIERKRHWSCSMCVFSFQLAAHNMSLHMYISMAVLSQYMQSIWPLFEIQRREDILRRIGPMHWPF